MAAYIAAKAAAGLERVTLDGQASIDVQELARIRKHVLMGLSNTNDWSSAQIALKISKDLGLNHDSTLNVAEVNNLISRIAENEKRLAKVEQNGRDWDNDSKNPLNYLNPFFWIAYGIAKADQAVEKAKLNSSLAADRGNLGNLQGRDMGVLNNSLSAHGNEASKQIGNVEQTDRQLKTLAETLSTMVDIRA